MKANKAPDKIYFDGESKACKLPIFSSQNIEYIRTDAFIEKAKEAFCKVTCKGHPPRNTCTSLGTCREYDNFVKFLREE